MFHTTTPSAGLHASARCNHAVSASGLCAMPAKTAKEAIYDQSKGPEESGGLAKVLKNNEAWSEQKKAADPSYFKDMEKGQKPTYLYLGCADSRVPAESLMGLQPGDMFVHRNIANMCPSWDVSVNAILQFGVGVLGCKHILVCGHTNCGGVHASTIPTLEGKNLSAVNTWLRTIRDVNRAHADFLMSIPDEKERLLALIEINVVEQCINVALTDVVKSTREEKGGYPHIHGLLYDIGNGLVRPVRPELKKRVIDAHQEHAHRIFSVDPSSVFPNLKQNNIKKNEIK